MMPPYLDTLKAFVEGTKDLKEWPAWWQENAQRIEKSEGRTCYLQLKLDWQKGALQLLEKHDIVCRTDPGINWNRCKTCGEQLFSVVPGVTRQEQIKKFAQESNLPGKAKIEKEAWLHPGVYCPNGCTVILMTSRENTG